MCYYKKKCLKNTILRNNLVIVNKKASMSKPFFYHKKIFMIKKMSVYLLYPSFKTLNFNVTKASQTGCTRLAIYMRPRRCPRR